MRVETNGRKAESERRAEASVRYVSRAVVRAAEAIASARLASYRALLRERAKSERPILAAGALDESEEAAYRRAYEYERANGATENEARDVAVATARYYARATKGNER